MSDGYVGFIIYSGQNTLCLSGIPYIWSEQALWLRKHVGPYPPTTTTDIIKISTEMLDFYPSDLIQKV